MLTGSGPKDQTLKGLRRLELKGMGFRVWGSGFTVPFAFERGSPKPGSIFSGSQGLLLQEAFFTGFRFGEATGLSCQCQG